MVTTEFSGEFHINTGVFKLQQEFTCEADGEQLDCRPDHGVISEIASILTCRQIEIRWIIETPARMGEARPEFRLWDRYWEIYGRHYFEEKLHHMEVHIVVYGQENQVNPGEHEYVRWQLHLRSELPLNDKQLKCWLEQFRDVLKRDIENCISGFSTTHS